MGWETETGQLEGLGDCKLPQWGPGQDPGRQGILYTLTAPSAGGVFWDQRMDYAEIC